MLLLKNTFQKCPQKKGHHIVNSNVSQIRNGFEIPYFFNCINSKIYVAIVIHSFTSSVFI